MRKTPTSVAGTIAACAAIVLLAGSLTACGPGAETDKTLHTTPLVGKAAPATPESNVEAPSAHAMIRSDIATALLPSVCGHPAGHMVDGKLPGIPPGQGKAQIDETSRNIIPGENIAIGDLNGDGVDDAAVQIWCNAGGVPWPDEVVIYVDGKPVAQSQFEAAHAARGGYDRLEIVDNTLRVTGPADGPNDASCCPTYHHDGTYRLEGNQLVPVGTVKYWKSTYADR